MSKKPSHKRKPHRRKRVYRRGYYRLPYPWTLTEKISLAALAVAALAAILSFSAPWIYHWTDHPETEMSVASGSFLWARYMGRCVTEEGTVLTAVLRDNNPTCPKGKIRDDNYIVSVPITFHNKGQKSGEISHLSLKMVTPRQEYTFEPLQLEQNTAAGLEIMGHIPDPIVVGPGSSESLILGFRSALRTEDRLVFETEDRGDTTILIEATVDGERLHKEFLFPFVGYVKPTGLIIWREAQ